MDYLTDCKIRYYGKDNNNEIKTQFKEKVNSNITSITHEMLCIFKDILNNEPSCYWNNAVYKQTLTQLETLYKDNSTVINFDYDILEHFFMGYHTYCQITDITNDLSKLNDSPIIKNRMYRIPTYVSIVEGCLTNLFRVITLILNFTTTKDFSSIKKLNPLCEILKSNGFNLLVSDVDINIRNAINHGGIMFKENGKTIEFHYTKNRKLMVSTIKSYEFDELINKVYDVASGVLLGICEFLNNHLNLISINRSEKSYVAFCLFSLELSIPCIRCKSISESPDGTQLNVDIKIDNSDRTYILQTAIELSMLVYEKYADYEKYFLSFSNERLQTSWVRFFNQEISDMINQNQSLVDVATKATQRQDVIIFNSSTEVVDLQEIKYYRYPSFYNSVYKINNVNDASLQDTKRLRAHLFIGNVEEKQEIINIIQQAIEWLKNVKNVPDPTMSKKHGEIEADSLYINVYRFDTRKNKELLSNNSNFVCLVDYNKKGTTTLVNGGIGTYLWNKLYHEKIEDTQFAWRESKYVIRHRQKKVGRNELCP